MQTSVGKALRALYKDGNKSAYFLLGDDYFLQNIFISKLKNYLKNNFETKYYYLNETNDVELLFNNINSVSLFASNTISIIKKLFLILTLILILILKQFHITPTYIFI